MIDDVQLVGSGDADVSLLGVMDRTIPGLTFGGSSEAGCEINRQQRMGSLE